MKSPLSSVRLLEVLVALCYGVVIGSLLPLPGPDSHFVLPAARAGAPIPPAAALQAPLVAETPGAGHLRLAGLSLAGTAQGDVDFAALRGARSTPAALGIGDTLPAAPTSVIAIPPPPRQRSGATHSVRTPLNSAAAADARGVSGSSDCTVILGDGSGADPRGCRNTVRRRLETLCPEPGDARRPGTIICIRSEP